MKLAAESCPRLPCSGDDRRVAGQVAADMACDRARPQVVTAAGAKPDDHLHLLAHVVAGRRLRGGGCAKHRRNGQNGSLECEQACLVLRHVTHAQATAD
jgi:hypothetical protein